MYSVHLWAPSNYHTARTDRLSPLKVINFVQITYNLFNLHCRAIRALQIEMINFTSQYNFKVKAQGQTKTICIFKFLTFLLIKWCKEYVSVILLKQKSNKYWGGKTSICSKTISLLDSWVLSLLLGTHVQHFYPPRKRFFFGGKGESSCPSVCPFVCLFRLCKIDVQTISFLWRNSESSYFKKDCLWPLGVSWTWPKVIWAS